MANPRTQIRQQQLTGSTVDIKARLDNTAAINNNQPGLASALTGSSQLDLFGYVGAALHRIHGASNDEPFNNQAGELSDGAGQIRVKYTNDGDTTIRGDSGIIDLTISDSLVRAHDNFQVDGNATIGSDASDSHTFNGDTAFVNDVEIRGDLKVVGDTTTTYITSSTVELQDPLLVNNAADFSGTENAVKARKAGTSFLSASADIENAAGTQAYDYGLVSKRAIGYSATLGAGNSAGANTAIPSRTHILEGGNKKFEDAGSVKFGSPLGVFKTTGVNGSDLAENNGADVTLNLDTVPRATINPADVLGAHLGAFVLLSSSRAATPNKRFGVIKSVDSANKRVTVTALANTERYDAQTGLGDALNNAAMAEGSVQLLSAYAGTIFDKEAFEFHQAAAAITGSGDNAFISGSANVMLYGGVKSARMSLMANNLVSGSQNVGQFDFIPEAEGTAKSYVTLKSLDSEDLNIKSAGDLILSGADAVKFVTNDGGSIQLPVADGTANQLVKTNGSGVLSFDDIGNLIPSLSRAAMRVKPGVTIAAGVGGLILTGANLAKDSVHFITASSGLAGGNGAKINELTDAELFSRVSLFVNGQLLVSGSGTSAGVASDADYTLKRLTGVPAGRISGSFAFDLEEDDTITLVVQAKS